jgi:hypothetical protein
LDAADPQVAANAVEYLGQYGSAGAEALLWSHLDDWHAHSVGTEDDPAAMQAGANLLNALATGHGWLADETTLHKLARMAVAPWQRQQVEAHLNEWQTRPLTIVFIKSDQPEFKIAQYQIASLEAAKEKLGQFPRGTQFRWLADKAKDEEDAFAELSRFAAGHGLRIQRCDGLEP